MERNHMGKEKIKSYICLHLAVMLFSFTSVFTKMASNVYKTQGIYSVKLYAFIFLMFLNCFIYAIVWQKVIKNFELSIAYANKSVYLIWSQIWAVSIFHETLNIRNIIGLILVLIGVLVVQENE